MVTQSLPRVALIAGPTASGKSALALALAEQRDGVIVNADSAQLYRDLPILSAAPSPADRARAEHRLYGVRDGAVPCSAAEWADLARERDRVDPRRGTPADPRRRHRPLSAHPARRHRPRAPDRSRDPRRGARRERGRKFRRADPARSVRRGAAQPGRFDAHRARARSRALVGADAWPSGRRSAAAGSATRSRSRRSSCCPPRDWLVERCDRRFAAMVDEGALGEVEALLARDLDPDLPVMRAIGVRELGALAVGRDEPRPGPRRRPDRHPPLCQAPIYLVRQPVPARLAALDRTPRRPRGARFRLTFRAPAQAGAFVETHALSLTAPAYAGASRNKESPRPRRRGN